MPPSTVTESILNMIPIQRPSSKAPLADYKKINSQTPSYKIDFSDAALKYAIDLKENARELSQIADELSDESTDSITYKR